MEYLQYSFIESIPDDYSPIVLNLVISGIPSILKGGIVMRSIGVVGFKPCYKWNTFNTNMKSLGVVGGIAQVLNLVISGIPSILCIITSTVIPLSQVLNLVISGIPSIPLILIRILILWLVNSLFRG